MFRARITTWHIIPLSVTVQSPAHHHNMGDDLCIIDANLHVDEKLIPCRDHEMHHCDVTEESIEASLSASFTQWPCMLLLPASMYWWGYHHADRKKSSIIFAIWIINPAWKMSFDRLDWTNHANALSDTSDQWSCMTAFAVRNIVKHSTSIFFTNSRFSLITAPGWLLILIGAWVM